jgi:hypothetical protein
MQETGCRIASYKMPRKEIDIWVKEEICFHFFPSILYGEREFEKGKPMVLACPLFGTFLDRPCI